WTGVANVADAPLRTGLYKTLVNFPRRRGVGVIENCFAIPRSGNFHSETATVVCADFDSLARH
ncbi:MAG: hypothetical protein ACRDKV_03555, partial [Solirubrobacterales bacterium]